jgi:hypothetical protein
LGKSITFVAVVRDVAYLADNDTHFDPRLTCTTNLREIFWLAVPMRTVRREPLLVAFALTTVGRTVEINAGAVVVLVVVGAGAVVVGAIVVGVVVVGAVVVTAATPVPVSATVAVLMTAFVAMVSVPLVLLAACGLNVMAMVHEALTATTPLRQVSLAIAKSPVTASAVTARAISPVFVTAKS